LSNKQNAINIQVLCLKEDCFIASLFVANVFLPSSDTGGKMGEQWGITSAIYRCDLVRKRSIVHRSHCI